MSALCGIRQAAEDVFQKYIRCDRTAAGAVIPREQAEPLHCRDVFGYTVIRGKLPAEPDIEER
jgi:hypothetical protein